MSRWVVAGLGIAGGVVGLYLVQTLTRATVPDEPEVSQSAAPVLSTREQVAQIVATEVAELHTEVDLDAYLDELEARARARGDVTALEVEPGMDAISQLEPVIGSESIERRHDEFGSRMARVGRELRGPVGGR